MNQWPTSRLYLLKPPEHLEYNTSWGISLVALHFQTIMRVIEMVHGMVCLVMVGIYKSPLTFTQEYRKGVGG